MPARGIEAKIFVLTGEGRLGQLYALHYSSQQSKSGVIIYFCEGRSPAVIAREYMAAGFTNVFLLDMFPHLTLATHETVVIFTSHDALSSSLDQFKDKVPFVIIEACSSSVIEQCIERALELGTRESVIIAQEPYPWRSIEYVGGKAFILPLEVFLTRKGKNRQYYRYVRAAAFAAQRMGIEGGTEYNERYWEDELLPSDPKTSYSDEWAGYGYEEFFDTIPYYETLEETRNAALSANLTNRDRYNRFYRQVDRRLPPKPWDRWRSTYVSDSVFFRQSTENGQNLSGARRIPPPTPVAVNRRVTVTGGCYSYEEGRTINIQLGIESYVEYEFRCVEDQLLPKSPRKHYDSPDFSWAYFAPVTTPSEELYDFQVARKVIIDNELKTPRVYFAHRKSDRRLPSDPGLAYGDMFLGWKRFLSYDLYDYATARQIIISNKLWKKNAYEAFCITDKQLPKNPKGHFGDAFPGWEVYLDRDYDIIAVMILVRQQGICTADEYFKKRFAVEGLPVNPHKTFGSQWPGWKRFLTEPLAKLQFLSGKK